MRADFFLDILDEYYSANEAMRQFETAVDGDAMPSCLSMRRANAGCLSQATMRRIDFDLPAAPCTKYQRESHEAG